MIMGHEEKEQPENRVREKCTTRPLLEPPVTKRTLSELDVNKIVHNSKLRHDINFDPELHFQLTSMAKGSGRKRKKQTTSGT